MKYIIAVEDKLRYLWELRLQLFNLTIQRQIPTTDIVVGIAFKPEHGISEYSKKIAKDFNVNIRYVPDKRKDISYGATIKPYVMKYIMYYEKITDWCMQLDSDVFFRENLDYSFLEDTNTWYMSNTNSYINYDYIKSKSHILHYYLADAVGIEPIEIVKNNNHSGGAQIIFKGNDWSFWEKVEKDSLEIKSRAEKFNQKELSYIPAKYRKEYNGFQIWCAEMWATLWNCWLAGNKSQIVSELDFCMATDSYNRFNKVKIYHNAGVVSESKSLFRKLDYQNEEPFKKDFSEIDKNRASYAYVELINEYNKWILSLE